MQLSGIAGIGIAATITDISFPQTLMNVLTPVKITVAPMPSALILLEVMTAPAMLDTLEMATHVMVGVILADKMYFGGTHYKSVHCTLMYVKMCTVMHVYITVQ